MKKIIALAFFLPVVVFAKDETLPDNETDVKTDSTSNHVEQSPASKKTVVKNAKELDFPASAVEIEAQKRNAKERMYKDDKIYSDKELKEIELLYQAANKNWKSEEGKASLEKLIKKYRNANRTGCALLYLGQMTRGKDQENYLNQAIQWHSDCFYGDGVQVGAFARFFLANTYLRRGEKDKAARLFKDIKNKYSDAITHNHQRLLPLVTQIMEKEGMIQTKK